MWGVGGGVPAAHPIPSCLPCWALCPACAAAPRPLASPALLGAWLRKQSTAAASCSGPWRERGISCTRGSSLVSMLCCPAGAGPRPGADRRACGPAHTVGGQGHRPVGQATSLPTSGGRGSCVRRPGFACPLEGGKRDCGAPASTAIKSTSHLHPTSNPCSRVCCPVVVPHSTPPRPLPPPTPPARPHPAGRCGRW